MLLEAVNRLQELVSDVAFSSAGTHAVEGKSTLAVIVSFRVPLTSGRIDCLRALSQLCEVLHRLVVEKVSVRLELFGGVGDLSELDLGSAVDNTEDVRSQPSNDLNCFIVLLKCLDERERSVAALFTELVTLSIDFSLALVDPDEVFLGRLDFGFDVLAVSSGIVSDLFVLISNGGEVSNLARKFSLLGRIDFVSLGLSINVRLLEVAEQSEC